ncbi:MAG: hypothetical protein GX307_07150 [Euryarchaeota archaeon]|nr:hypothetical protein [Euryarchaeota archaeon]
MVNTLKDPFGKLAVMQKRGILVALVGLLISFLGSLERSAYWSGFLQITGAFLTAAGAFLFLYALVRD